MKKTQFKDAVRNIRKRWVSYLSVIVIAILGTSIFLSIGFAGTAIARNATEMYDAMHFRHVEVISTLLVTEDDLDVFRSLDGVKCAEPVWQAGIYASHGEERRSHAYLITAGQEINVPQILEGRLPETPDECAIEQSFAEAMEYRVGDVLDDFTMTDDMGQYVLSWEFRITGIVTHPDHISETIRETPYVLTVKEAFDLETLQGASMKAEIVLEDPDGGSRFSGRHSDAVSALVGKIEALAPERTPLTDAAVKKAAYAQIDQMKEERLKELERVKRETPEDTETIEYYENSLSDYDEYYKNIDAMAPCRWIVLGERSNVGFDQVLSCLDTLRHLRMNFGLLFIGIGALTILATIGKLVSEQRTQVGTVKALGFTNREILQKYLLFGVSAVAAGTIAGSLAGRFFMEKIVLDNYNSSFTVDLSAPVFDWVSVLTVLLAGILLTSVTVWIACRNLMKESANALMLPPVPKGLTKTREGRKNVFGLYSRLILRNIRSDWKRVAVSVVCVLGCCAMIGVGFTLKSAVNNCPEKQASEVVAYDAKLVCDPLFLEDFQEILDGAGTENFRLYSATAVLRTGDYRAAQLLCGDMARILEMYRLVDWKTSEPLPPTDDGIYIHQRLAETCGLHAGSEIELTVGLQDTATVRVAGVFRNYLGLPVVMSGGYYESLFAKELTPNAFLVRLNGADPAAVSSQVKVGFGLVSWETSDSERAAFETAMGSINSVDTLLIAIAAVMAGVVQLNLISTYIQQKKRELILMRINGFTVRELVGYLLRETVLTTVTGILLGIAAGSGIGYLVVRSVELSYAQFDRSLCLPAWLYAAGITILFTVVINAVALQKLRKLKMTDLE